MIERIAGALQSNARVHDWQIRRHRSQDHQLFLTGTRVESRRRSLSDWAEVDLYHDHPDRGMTSLTFLPGELDDLDDRIERGVFMASLTGNPASGLPGPADYPSVPLQDPILVRDPWRIIDEWCSAFRESLARDPDVRLSSAEFFVTREDTEFRNSRGASASYPATRVLVEMVLLSGNGTKSSENYHLVTVRSAADFNPKKVIRERSEMARDMLRVRTPKSVRGPVTISGESLIELFPPFLARIDAENLYRRIFQTKVGDDLFDSRIVTGDPLDLASDPTIPFGVHSAPFDADGLPLHRVQAIRNGRVESLLATKRYADYLDIPATGTMANIVVGAGSVSYGKLIEGPVRHLVSFSDLYADPISGDFVSEIRLGYEIGADGTRVPIKGGSLSGNVFDAFANCLMSQEVVHHENYVGPRAVRFEDLTISGD